MTEPVYGLTDQAAKLLNEMADKHRQRLPDVGRRTRRVYRGGSIKVLGPCATYTPDEDSAFNIDFGGGCLGPNRYAMIYITTISAEPYTIVLDYEDPSSPLLFSSDTFTHGCMISSLSLYAVLEVVSRDLNDVTLTFYDAGDDSVVAVYQNTMFAWLPMIGGYLQAVTTPCTCSTFPFDICLSPPTR